MFFLEVFKFLRDNIKSPSINLCNALSVFLAFHSFQRNLTFSCAESNSFSVFFNSTSFLKLPGQSDSDTLSVSLSFRTWNPSGLLMFTTLADGWVEVGLSEGKVIVYVTLTQTKTTRIDISSGERGSYFDSLKFCFPLTSDVSCRFGS